MNTDVSVIIPTHNRRHTLERALTSVVQQRHPPHEIIVVDDGSTDGTADWLRSTWPAVTLLEQDNRGVSAARNRGIARSSATWIALLDSDDAWHPDKLAHQIAALRTDGRCRLCHTDETWYRNGVRVNPRQRHRKSGGHIFMNCLPLCAISPSAAVIHRDVFEDIGEFDVSLPACEDYDFWLRLCAREPVLYVDEALVIKTGGHDDQLSRRYPAMDRFRIQSLLQLLETVELSPENYRAALDTLDGKLTVYGNGARKRGRADEVERLQARRDALTERTD